jgi:cell filamentation protein
MSGTFAELKKNRYLRDLPSEIFATQAAHFLAALNAIHPFRDGNGRTQLAFTAMLAAHAGHPLALERLEPETFLSAMIRSFQGNERLLADEITDLVMP